MSFRVWFLRMVWIVAAAVALSGCPDDEGNTNGNETDGEGDGPTLAIGAIGNVTVGVGNETATIKVTITSDAADDKTAEVTLSVMCNKETVKVAEAGKMTAAGGVATYTDVDLGQQEADVDCTADASATLGGEKVEATQVKFKIVAAEATGPSLTLAIHDDSNDSIGAVRTAGAAAIAEAGKVHAKVMVTGKKADNTDVAVTDLVVTWNCVKDTAATTNVFATDNTVVMAPAAGGGFTGMITLDDDNNELANAAVHTCTIKASITGVSGSEKTATVAVNGTSN